MMEEAEEIIDNAYGLIEESDTLIQITEQGLKKAITEALRAAYIRGLERAAEIAIATDVVRICDPHDGEVKITFHGFGEIRNAILAEAKEGGKNGK